MAGCERKFYGHGFCSMHLRRFKNNGDPLIRQGTGDGPCVYSQAHTRVARRLGSAKAWPCVGCGKQAAEWSYDHNDPNEARNEFGHPYSYDPDHYAPRCKRCHSVFDSRRAAGRPRPDTLPA